MQRINTDQVKSTSSKYNSFSDQLVGMSIPYVKLYSATADQVLFTLTNDMIYDVGSGQLEVYLNGQITSEGKTSDYFEVDNNKFQFNTPLVEGDQVLVRIEGVGGGVVVENDVKFNNFIPVGAINGINKVFSLPHIPNDGTLKVYINGLVQGTNTYTLNKFAFTLDEAPRSYFSITVDYEI